MRTLASRYALEAVVFVVALAFRLAVTFSAGGVRGFVGPDQAVYYSGAMALSFGNLPYRDFSYVHPPLSLLALQPAAWVGRLADDQTGFGVGNVWFVVLGAVTAVLVVLIVRALGMPVSAQLAGGLFYAAWSGSVGAEYSSMLEPLGNVVLALGVLLLVHSRAPGPRSVRLTWCAGAVLGLTLSIKIWWVVPLLFLLAWEGWRSRDARVAGRLVGGAVVASVLLNLPFLLASRGDMWRFVVEAQGGRPRRHPDWGYRWGTMTGVRDSFASVPLTRASEILVGLVLLACVALALRRPASRVFAYLLVLQAGVLWLSPSFFPHYVDYLAVAAALTVAGATAQLASAVGARRVVAAAPGFVALVAVLGVCRLANGVPHLDAVVDRDELVAAASGYECVRGDLPMNVVVVDALERSFEPGCGNRVDVRGEALAMDKTGPRNVFARRALVAYLRRADAVVLNAHALATIGQEPGLRGYSVVFTTGQYAILVPQAP